MGDSKLATTFGLCFFVYSHILSEVVTILKEEEHVYVFSYLSSKDIQGNSRTMVGSFLRQWSIDCV